MYNPITLTEAEARSLAAILDGELAEPLNSDSPTLTLVQKLEKELDCAIAWFDEDEDGCENDDDEYECEDDPLDD